MSSKAGYLKESKAFTKENIGNVLQSFGQKGSDFYANPMVQRGFEWAGRAAGHAIPIPIVGGMIGKAAGGKLADTLSYTHGLIGEVGGMINGEKNIGDVLSYVPSRMWEDFKNDTINSDTAKVIRGEMNWRDAVVNTLEDNAMIDILAPGKTHAWKDAQGNYHKEYVDGATMVVGEWKEQPNTAPRPEMKHSDILGVYQGQVLYKGFDDALYNSLKENGTKFADIAGGRRVNEHGQPI